MVPVYCRQAVVGGRFGAVCHSLGHFNLNLSALWACMEQVEPLPHCPAFASWASLKRVLIDNFKPPLTMRSKELDSYLLLLIIKVHHRLLVAI